MLLNSLSSLSKNTRIADRFYYSNCGTFELLVDNSNERHLVFHLTCQFYMQEIAKWFYVKIPHNPFYIYAELRKSPSDSSHTSWNLTLVLCVIDLSCCSASQQSPSFATVAGAARLCYRTAADWAGIALLTLAASLGCKLSWLCAPCPSSPLRLQTCFFLQPRTAANSWRPNFAILYINPQFLEIGRIEDSPYIHVSNSEELTTKEELVTFVSSRTLHTLLFEELSDFNKSNYWRSKWPLGQSIYWPTINNPTVAACDKQW